MTVSRERVDMPPRKQVRPQGGTLSKRKEGQEEVLIDGNIRQWKTWHRGTRRGHKMHQRSNRGALPEGI